MLKVFNEFDFSFLACDAVAPVYGVWWRMVLSKTDSIHSLEAIFNHMIYIRINSPIFFVINTSSIVLPYGRLQMSVDSYEIQ